MTTRPQHLACLTVGACFLGLCFSGLCFSGLCFFGLCFFGVCKLEAQERRWPALYRDTAEVNVVNVDVFVSDADGRPVRGLGKDDFQLLADGRPVEISNFYAVEGGRAVSVRADPQPDADAVPGDPRTPEPEERRLRMIVFVDNENITAANRRRVFQRLRKLLLEHRRADVEMMLVSHELAAAGRSLVVRQGFTSVAHEVFVALDELENLSVGGNRLDIERRNLIRALDELNVDAAAGIPGVKGRSEDPQAEAFRAINEARSLVPRILAYSEQRFAAARQALGALTRMVDMLAALPGRKALVYASDGLPLKPGEALFESYANRLLSVGPIASELSAQAEAARFDTTRDVLALVERANAGRVTFYALDASPPAAVQGGAAESRFFRTAGTAAVDERSRHDSLTLMAEGTGGRAGLTSSSLEAALEGVFTDFDHYYSLGYVAEPGDERSQSTLEESTLEVSTLEVTVRGRDVQVRHRRGFRVRSSEEEASQRVLSALLLDLREDSNPLAVNVWTGDVTRRDDGTFVVPLLVEVPLDKLVLVPGKAEHEARVSLYVAARDARGRISEVTRHLCPIRIPNSEVLLALGRTTVCGVRLGMRGGVQEVAVAVRDDVADLESIVRLELDVPNGLHPSGALP